MYRGPADVRYRVSIGLLAVCLTSSSVAAAGPNQQAVRLAYTRGEGAEHCPDELELRNAVTARLGYDPFEQGADHVLSATITHQGGKLVGRMSVRDADGALEGSRDITSSENDCSELSSALALAISIAIDPLSLTRPQPAPVPSAPACPKAPTPPCPVLPEPPAPAPAPEPEPDHPIGFRASAGFHGAFGAAPGPAAFGLAAAAGIRWRALSVAVGGRIDFPSSKDAGVGTVSSSLVLGTLAPCGHVSIFSGCALAVVGALRGENVGAQVRDTTPFAAAGARAGLELPIYGALGVRISADLLATLTRTALSIDDVEVWTTPPAHGAVGIAILGDFR